MQCIGTVLVYVCLVCVCACVPSSQSMEDTSMEVWCLMTAIYCLIACLCARARVGVVEHAKVQICMWCARTRSYVCLQSRIMSARVGVVEHVEGRVCMYDERRYFSKLEQGADGAKKQTNEQTHTHKIAQAQITCECM